MFAEIFRDSVKNFTGLFSWRSSVWHVVAILLTGVLVLSGFDWAWYEATRSTMWHPLVWIAGITGFFVPVALPLVLYLVGEWRRNERLMYIAGRIAQAVILASLLAIFFKAFTGRVEPDFIYMIGAEDISREFQFGFLRHGIFWGWPSSHAAVACAGAFTLVRLIRVRWVTVTAGAYALVICAGAAIGFHWLSDVVAGVIFGILVGFVVSRNTDLLK